MNERRDSVEQEFFIRSAQHVLVTPHMSLWILLGLLRYKTMVLMMRTMMMVSNNSLMMMIITVKYLVVLYLTLHTSSLASSVHIRRWLNTDCRLLSRP